MKNNYRKYIYLFLIISLAFPLVSGYYLKPVPSKVAERFFEKVDNLEKDKGYAFLALDFGPQSSAENMPQAKVVIEHLMKKRIPIVFFSIAVYAEPILESIPDEIAKKLESKYPNEKWEYGKDWINLGYRPGQGLLLQTLPKSKDLKKLFAKDARGNDLNDFPNFSNFRTLKDITFLGEFTGYVGVFDMYLQFFKSKDYTPIFCHGCTSITIPESHIYLDSGQIQGLLEGISGASWYEELLNKKYDDRKSYEASQLNTGVGVAQLLIVFLIILGNLRRDKK